MEPIAHIGPPEIELIGRIKALRGPGALVINRDRRRGEEEDLLAAVDVHAASAWAGRGGAPSIRSQLERGGGRAAGGALLARLP
ncbi:MAG: hypothetical protein ACLRWQ_21575 [Flavonifractor plautii]